MTNAFVAPAGIDFLNALAVVGKSVELVLPVTNAMPALFTLMSLTVSSPLPPRKVE